MWLRFTAPNRPRTTRAGVVNVKKCDESRASEMKSNRKMTSSSNNNINKAKAKRREKNPATAPKLIGQKRGGFSSAAHKTRLFFAFRCAPLTFSHAAPLLALYAIGLEPVFMPSNGTGQSVMRGNAPTSRRAPNHVLTLDWWGLVIHSHLELPSFVSQALGLCMRALGTSASTGSGWRDCDLNAEPTATEGSVYSTTINGQMRRK